MLPQFYLAYLLACFAVVIVPGPTAALIIANSLTHGSRAGLLNVAGTQLGLVALIGILIAGLTSIIATTAWFDLVRLAGAAYLFWLGIRSWRSGSKLDLRASTQTPRGGFLLQGFLVIITNPKALLFFGAFIPQFIQPEGDYTRQVVWLGVMFMAVATVCDGAYAVLTGRAASLMSPDVVRWLSRMSGMVLVVAGLCLGLMRTR
jgi:homoserine/homoserine lactone efflux protein